MKRMDKEQKEFYIGWQDEMPKGNKHFLKKVLVPLFILLPLVAIAIVLFQRSFSNNQADWNSMKEITGTYYHTPVPMLVADATSLPDTLSKNILLVGYGKFGAEGIMNTIQKNTEDLNGKKIRLQGVLLHGDGKTLMQVSDEKSSLIETLETNSVVQATPQASPKEPIELRGEILDPKCYFGVMKPGEGKIHKSCAIRCISGGIPPVFRQKNDKPDNSNRYFIILDKNGHKVNKAVLQYVAEDVSVRGETNTLFGWDVLYINPNEIQKH